MSSLSFGFNINSPSGLFPVEVNNAQIEIDGGYEGDTTLNLIEAKNYISEDFLVRQLYYPFKLWKNKVQKQVHPIFMTYTNGIFHLREYAFNDVNHYNSIVLVKQRKYVIREGSFNLQALLEIIHTTATIKEPEIPFPQADSFERVVNLCELLKERGTISKEEITQNYDFDARQTDYYSNAGKYIGLIEFGKDPASSQVYCYLTPKGKEVFSLSLFERQKEFIRLIISHSVFKQVLEIYLGNGEIPSKEFIVEIMKNSKLHNITSEATYLRRASTIVGWINWIINQTEE